MFSRSTKNRKKGRNTSASTVLALEIGSSGKIFMIKGGRGVIQRLNDLGLTIGTEITLMNKSPFTGPVILLVRGSSIVIGRGIAAKIYIRE